jgi:hypothetical protein
MFSQTLVRLSKADVPLSAGIDSGSAPPDELLLQTLVLPRSSELHYVAHFSEPLQIKIGDIGYISGQPPRFTKLENAYREITDRTITDGRHFDESVWPLRKLPPRRWSTTQTRGITRYYPYNCSRMLDLFRDIGTRFAFENLMPRNSRIGLPEDRVSPKILP